MIYLGNGKVRGEREFRTTAAALRTLTFYIGYVLFPVLVIQFHLNHQDGTRIRVGAFIEENEITIKFYICKFSTEYCYIFLFLNLVSVP